MNKGKNPQKTETYIIIDSIFGPMVFKGSAEAVARFSEFAYWLVKESDMEGSHKAVAAMKMAKAMGLEVVD